MFSGKHLPVVPSQESYSGLPYSKPTRDLLSHAAPWKYLSFSFFVFVLLHNHYLSHLIHFNLLKFKQAPCVCPPKVKNKMVPFASILKNSYHQSLCSFSFQYRGQRCTWMCLQHRGLSGTCTNMDSKSRCRSWRYLHHSDLGWTWTCLYQRGLSFTWT
jgi:hypothetical protein